MENLRNIPAVEEKAISPEDKVFGETARLLDIIEKNRTALFKNGKKINFTSDFVRLSIDDTYGGNYPDGILPEIDVFFGDTWETHTPADYRIPIKILSISGEYSAEAKFLGYVVKLQKHPKVVYQIDDEYRKCEDQLKRLGLSDSFKLEYGTDADRARIGEPVRTIARFNISTGIMHEYEWGGLARMARALNATAFMLEKHLESMSEF